MFRATSKMQENVRSMQEEMKQQQQKAQSTARPDEPAKEKPVEHEYIDFEEVK